MVERLFTAAAVEEVAKAKRHAAAEDLNNMVSDGAKCIKRVEGVARQKSEGDTS